MISFQLDPPSGYAHSYLDVKFIVRFPKSEKAVIQVANVTANQILSIIGSSRGFIQNEDTLVVKNSNIAEGYINIFNKDKMNNLLADSNHVDIKCSVVLTNNGIEQKEEQTTSFYNQSKSLDGSIIPFDCRIQNTTIDFASGNPFKISVTGDGEKKYEMCIRSSDGENKCVFEIITTKGTRDFILPLEVIWHDLSLYKNRNKTFHLYWVKFEGLDYRKYMNRVYIPVDNASLVFSNSIKAEAQDRAGPIGLLPKEFVLSDRYLVHTWKDFSGFGNLTNVYGLKRLYYMTRFFHESQNMQQVDQISLFQSDDINKNIKQAVRQESLSRKIKSHLSPPHKDLMSNFYNLSKSINPATQKSPAGGCGCSRKRNA